MARKRRNIRMFFTALALGSSGLFFGATNCFSAVPFEGGFSATTNESVASGRTLALYDLPLESLLQVIVTASKKEEKLFDASVAANVLSGERIRRSGVNSIPEALRLIPGLIVREQTNGNYDVHIRGLGNIPADSAVVRTSNNNLTLVMIDNRVVYNHYTGGTFWEQLAVDINDIDRIEVVKGATAAMYGPNAVTGVIHIITKRVKAADKTYIQSSAGSAGTQITSASTSFPVGRFAARVAVHHQQRERFEESYYEFLDGGFHQDPAEIETLPFSPGGPLPDPYVKYPDTKNALNVTGANIFFEGKSWANGDGRVALGIHSSEVQKVYDDNAATPLTTAAAKSWYMSAESSWETLTTRLQIKKGNTDVLGSPFFSFDYQNIYWQLDGQYSLGGIDLQPLLHYRHQDYSGEAFSGDASMDIVSLGLRSETTRGKWRYTGAIRGEYYDYSRDIEVSYLFTASYQPVDRFLFRSSYGRATQEPFMLNIFEELSFPNTNIMAFGNEEIKVVEADNAELGLRWIIGAAWRGDIEAFWVKSKNYQTLTSEDFTTFTYQNLDDVGEIKGLTASLEYKKEHWDGTVFLTQQETELKHSITDKNLNTPSYYGGMTLNYHGFSAWNINLSVYLFDSSSQLNAKTIDLQNLGPDPESQVAPEARVDSKVLLNTKISYRLNDNFTSFLNIRNAADARGREFAMVDETRALYLLGFDWKI